MKEKILALLRTSNDYISGQAICEKLGVSRTAVWKNINALKAEGYIIDAVNNKGYRLGGGYRYEREDRGSTHDIGDRKRTVLL